MTSVNIRQFHVSRVALIGEMQNIIFGEWLPILLGEDAVETYGLDLDDDSVAYDGEVDPSIVNAFSTAAFR